MSNFWGAVHNVFLFFYVLELAVQFRLEVFSNEMFSVSVT